MIRLFFLTIASILVVIAFSGCATSPSLISAACNGDVSRIEVLLKNGADVNIKDGSWNE